ncbi:MAG: HAD-IB family hydrolase [Actinomycetota bacterium]
MQAAFFDLDKTVISRSSSFSLARPMYRAGMVSRRTVVQSAYAQMVFMLLGADERRLDRAKGAMLKLTKGWERARLEALVHEVMEEVIDPFVYQEALELMAEHRAAGREVWIVSTSPEEIVRPLAEHFGATGVIATRAAVTPDGRYTGELEFYCFRETKAEAMRQLAERRGIDLASSFAYSDSVTDLPMLEAVGNPSSVNPDRELRREAEQREWPVLVFRRPVRLMRRRAPASSDGGSGGGLVVVWAAAAILVAAGVLVWIWMRGRRSRR